MNYINVLIRLYKELQNTESWHIVRKMKENENQIGTYNGVNIKVK